MTAVTIVLGAACAAAAFILIVAILVGLWSTSRHHRTRRPR